MAVLAVRAAVPWWATAAWVDWAATPAMVVRAALADPVPTPVPSKMLSKAVTVAAVAVAAPVVLVVLAVQAAAWAGWQGTRVAAATVATPAAVGRALTAVPELLRASTGRVPRAAMAVMPASRAPVAAGGRPAPVAGSAMAVPAALVVMLLCSRRVTAPAVSVGLAATAETPPGPVPVVRVVTAA
jgi:hypothetical protein